MISPDLHTHSTASDGTLTPSVLLDRAAQAGIQLFALTDHDTVAGLQEAAIRAQQHGIQFFAGVEISVTWHHRTIHIVGLGIDPNCAMLTEGLEFLRQRRQQRATEIAHRLAVAGYPDALDGARRYSNGVLISRTHFARFLLSQGVAQTTRAVFKRFLTVGNPGYVATNWVDLDTAIDWIQTAGGIAVIAHPARYALTQNKLKQLIQEFKNAGGYGLEVISGSHSREDYQMCARHAQMHQLRASAGSDYHGPENPWIELGHLPALPEQCQPIWQDWPITVLKPC
jgi:hypothetical protein